VSSAEVLWVMTIFECRTRGRILILIKVKGKMSLCTTFWRIGLSATAAPLLIPRARWMWGLASHWGCLNRWVGGCVGPRTGLDVLGKIKVVCYCVGPCRYRNGSVMLICVWRNGCLQPKHVAAMLLCGVHLYTYMPTWQRIVMPLITVIQYTECIPLYD